MKKEIIPTFFDNDDDCYIRLEYFVDSVLIKRATIKVEKSEQEEVKEMFEDYNKKTLDNTQKI